jgi:hypothetical protein
MATQIREKIFVARMERRNMKMPSSDYKAAAH